MTREAAQRLLRRWSWCTATVLFLVPVLAAGSGVSGAATATYDWPQFGESDWSGVHSGNNTQESTISASNVGSLTQQFRVSLPSVADGTPVYLGAVTVGSSTENLVFLTTKDGHILALDAQTGATVWSKQYGPGSCISTNGGVCFTTSSPAVDPNRQYVYTYGLDGKVHKLSVSSGSEVTSGGWPEVATLKPSQEKSSPALSIAVTPTGSYLYVANGGYPGDGGDYQGHVTAINLATGTQRAFNTLCSNQAVHFTTGGTPDCSQTQSAVWSRPGVVYDPDTNEIYLVTGNAAYAPTSYDWGDSVLALHPDGSGSTSIAGYPVDSWTPSNFATLQADDTDLGSTAPAILPSSAIPAGSSYHHLGVQSGKDGYVRLLNLDNLSGQGGPGHTGGELASVALPSGMFGEVLSQPAVWLNPADNSIWVFITNNWGIAAYTLTINAGGVPGLQVQWSTLGSVRDSLGSSPLVVNGVLFDARPNIVEARNPITGQQLWSSTTIGGIHWEHPVVANGSLYIADDSGYLTSYSPTASSSTTAVEGTDGALWVRHGSGTWTSLGGVLSAAPAVARLPGGSALYLVAGSDHTVWERAESSSWQKLSSFACQDNPAADVSSTTLTVACQGSDHALYTAQTSVSGNVPPTTLSTFATLGGVTGYGPALSPVNGVLTYFVIGTDSRIWWRTSSAGWQPLSSSCSGHPAASSAGGTTYLACHGSDGALWYATDSGSGWSGFHSLGGSMVDGPGVAAGGSGAFFVIQSSNNVDLQNQLALGGASSGWQATGGRSFHGAAAGSV